MDKSDKFLNGNKVIAIRTYLWSSFYEHKDLAYLPTKRKAANRIPYHFIYQNVAENKTRLTLEFDTSRDETQLRADAVAFSFNLRTHVLRHPLQIEHATD